MKSLALRFVLVCLLVLTALSFAVPAFAEDETLPDPGLTPDSPLYFFDGLSKKVSLFFTFDDEAKARKALGYAEERLAEARAMAAKNRVRETERAADDYDRYMAQVRQRLENRAVSTDLSERVALAAARHLDILERAGEQVLPEARAALERARIASADGQMDALRALAEDSPELAIEIIEENLDRQTEKAVIRLVNKASDNVTADADGVLDHAERLAALEDEMTALAGENGVDITGIVERLEQSTSNRLQALNGVYENAPENARPGIGNAIENSVRKYERSLEKLRAGSLNPGP
jgi:hypothetical protein